MPARPDGRGIDGASSSDGSTSGEDSDGIGSDGRPRLLVQRSRLGSRSRASLTNTVDIRFAITREINHEYLNDLAKRFATRLTSIEFDIKKRNSVIRKTLSINKANMIANFVFNDMLGASSIRLQDLADDVANYNAAVSVATRLDPEAPVLVQNLVTHVNTAIISELNTISRYIMRNIALVGLSTAWGQIQSNINSDTPDGRELLAYLERRRRQLNIHSTTGITNLSIAKTVFAECLGLSPKTFHALTQDAIVPAALDRLFGHGALLLIPEGKTK